ncbi:MAG TPA: cobalamin-independent methionine synthase II family protein [Vicinamibacteria bacterium]|nr:cobalamin-independent methionine synthase II family protein [Vicinamibacteria bacterium]
MSRTEATRGLPPFPTSVVGSLPRPALVRDLIELPADDPGRAAAMDAAVAYAIALQRAAGIDVVSDGEWRRRSYIGVIAEIAHGFARETRDGVSWHTVVEPLRPRRPGLLGEEARFLVAHARGATKVALPSPYLLAARMWDPARSRDAYPTREAFMRALVPFLRRELEAVRDAGATVAQLDDPHLCLLVDPRVRAGFADPDAEARLCVDLLNEIVDGVGGILTAVHLCRRNKARQGWVGEGGYEPIVPALRALRVDQYVLEFTIPVAGDLAVLRQLPDDRLIGLGCVDCRAEAVETPEAIAARVRQALRYVDAARVWLNPDCGFAPGSAADIPVDEAYAKLRSEAAAAGLLRNTGAGA